MKFIVSCRCFETLTLCNKHEKKTGINKTIQSNIIKFIYVCIIIKWRSIYTLVEQQHVTENGGSAGGFFLGRDFPRYGRWFVT